MGCPVAPDPEIGGEISVVVPSPGTVVSPGGGSILGGGGLTTSTGGF